MGTRFSKAELPTGEIVSVSAEGDLPEGLSFLHTMILEEEQVPSSLLNSVMKNIIQ